MIVNLIILNLLRLVCNWGMVFRVLERTGGYNPQFSEYLKVTPTTVLSTYLFLLVSPMGMNTSSTSVDTREKPFIRRTPKFSEDFIDNLLARVDIVEIIRDELSKKPGR